MTAFGSPELAAAAGGVRPALDASSSVGPGVTRPRGAVAAAAVALGVLVLTGLPLGGWDHGPGAAPFAASLFVIGMAHGAADLAVFRRMVRGWPRRRSVAAALGYLAVDGLALLVLLAAPVVALSMFLFVSVLHFGATRRAGLVRRAVRGGGAYRVSFHGADIATGYGEAAAVVLTGFLLHPAATAAVFADLRQIAGGTAAFPLPVVQAAAVVATLGLAAAAAAAAYGLLRRRPDAGWRSATLLGIVTAHLLLPPLAAVGVLFLVWHAGPECVRLGGWLTPPDPPARRPAAGFRAGVFTLTRIITTHRRSLPLLIPTVVVVVVLAFAHRSAAAGTSVIEALAAFTLLAYAVLTPAHELLHAAARRSVWNEAGQG